LKHVVVNHCDARAQVKQRRWKEWYENTILVETPQEEITQGEIWGTWWPTHQFLIPRSCTADPSLWQSISEVSPNVVMTIRGHNPVET
jgi:hypothetical protein